MALRTSVTNTEKLGTVLVTQTDLVADTADTDVSNVDISKAKKVLSLEMVNGSTSDIFFKIYDSASPTLASDTPAFKIKIAANSTQFIGSSLGVPFTVAISVAASTESGASNSPTAYVGTASYTLIAGV